jgi:hypothetical protein
MDLFSKIVIFICVILFPVAWYKIFKKAGYSPAWFIVMLFPFVNIFAMVLFAFSVWPIERESIIYGHKKVGKML